MGQSIGQVPVAFGQATVGQKKGADIAVVYHGPVCNDGFGAALAAYMYFTNAKHDFDFIPMNYNEQDAKLPELNGYRWVYVLDFSFTKEQLTLWSAANPRARMRIIDHHKTARDDLMRQTDPKDDENGYGHWIPRQDLPPNVELQFDMSKSGAYMAWMYFFRTEPPIFFQYLQDWDLFTKKLPGVDAFTRAISTTIGDFDAWESYIEGGQPRIEELIREGESMLRYYNSEQDKILKNVELAEIENLGRFAIVNANYLFASNGGAELLRRFQSIDFAVIWSYDYSSRQCIISLRSRPNGYDVGKLAKSLSVGGGGHQAAAGFTCTLDRFQEIFGTH